MQGTAFVDCFSVCKHVVFSEYAAHAEQHFSSMLNAVLICCLSCFQAFHGCSSVFACVNGWGVASYPRHPGSFLREQDLGGGGGGGGGLCVAAIGCLGALFCFNRGSACDVIKRVKFINFNLIVLPIFLGNKEGLNSLNLK